MTIYPTSIYNTINQKARDNLTWDLRIPPSREPPVDTANGRYGGRRGGR